MSAREEKLELASKRTTAGPARCTLAQLRARWGCITRPEKLWVGAEVVKATMDGLEGVEGDEPHRPG
jgi:hypothetical protein